MVLALRTKTNVIFMKELDEPKVGTGENSRGVVLEDKERRGEELSAMFHFWNNAEIATINNGSRWVGGKTTISTGPFVSQEVISLEGGDSLAGEFIDQELFGAD